jgi:hypothetical protein
MSDPNMAPVLSLPITQSAKTRSERILERRLDWVALHMPYLLCPVLVGGVWLLVEVFHG